MPRTSSIAQPSPLAHPRAAPVDVVMRRLRREIERMERPAIEKLSEENASTAFETLIATMLSAQTKDAVTHAASLRLFAVANTPGALAKLPASRIARLIYPVSFYRTKARHVRECCRQIVERFGGHVPATMDGLLTLPGVGRKTATLVLIVAHESPDHICVDTHVHRIANRFGWVKTKTPEKTERALYAATARRWWAAINLHLVTWGQQVCKPVYPLCGACALADVCPRLGVTRQGKAERP
ncbi:MAG: endonuclease III [Acidobacteria bacterium]|nr:endonuclease III [Acidobacteriota bacterium]